MFRAKELADIMAKNTAQSDISLDEMKAIVKYYINLHNRLYEKKWLEEEYLATFLKSFAKKRLKHLQRRHDL